MTKDKAIEGAKREAAKYGCDILVVESPLDVRSHNEFEEGSYGYGPDQGISLLFGWGVIVHRVNPNGSVHNIVPPLVIDHSKFDVIKDSEKFESLGQ
jgi:hypothetical protein